MWRRLLTCGGQREEKEEEGEGAGAREAEGERSEAGFAGLL